MTKTRPFVYRLTNGPEAVTPGRQFVTRVREQFTGLLDLARQAGISVTTEVKYSPGGPVLPEYMHDIFDKVTHKGELTMATYKILIDDDDRESCPDTPWTATLYDDADPQPLAVGLGATVHAATSELLDNLVDEADEDTDHLITAEEN